MYGWILLWPPRWLSAPARLAGALAVYDRLDVLTMAVAYWVEQMARDVDMAIADGESVVIGCGAPGFHGPCAGLYAET